MTFPLHSSISDPLWYLDQQLVDTYCLLLRRKMDELKDQLIDEASNLYSYQTTYFPSIG